MMPTLTDGHEAELRQRRARLLAEGNHAGADAVARDLAQYQASHLPTDPDVEPSPAEDVHPEQWGEPYPISSPQHYQK